MYKRYKRASYNKKDGVKDKLFILQAYEESYVVTT